MRNKPIAFLTSSLPSPSSLLKLPITRSRTGAETLAIHRLVDGYAGIAWYKYYWIESGLSFFSLVIIIIIIIIIIKWLDIPKSGTLSNVFLIHNKFGLNICPPSVKFTQCQRVLRN